MENLLITATTFPRWQGDNVPSFVLELALHLKPYFNVTVLAPHSKGAKAFEKIEGITVYRYRYFFERFEKLTDGAMIPNLKKNKLLYLQVPLLLAAQFFAVRKIIKKEKIDKIQAHWIIPQGFIARITKFVYNKPYYIVSHGADIFGLNNIFFNFFKKLSLRKASKISAVSSAIRDKILVQCPQCTVDIIPMGVNLGKFSTTPRSRASNRILFVGRISEKKGLKYLILAMPEILKKNPQVVLQIVGKGEEEHNIRQLVSELKLDKSVQFIGAVPHETLPRYYASASVFIGPSVQSDGGDMEGFGLVFAEAMASGTPTICTDLPAMRDIIIDNKTGFVVHQKSSIEIADKVNYILKHRKEANQIALAGKTFVNENFGWDIISKKYAQHLK